MFIKEIIPIIFMLVLCILFIFIFINFEKIYKKIRNNLIETIEETKLQLSELEDHYNKFFIANRKLEEEIEIHEMRQAAINDLIARESAAREQYAIQLSERDKEDIEKLTCLNLYNDKVIPELIWKYYYQDKVNNLTKQIFGTKSISGIYRIVNIETNECYVGKSVDVVKRIKEHIKGSLGISTIADQAIHQAMAQDITKWQYELLAEVSSKQLSEEEKYWIEYFGASAIYNKRKG